MQVSNNIFTIYSTNTNSNKHTLFLNTTQLQYFQLKPAQKFKLQIGNKCIDFIISEGKHAGSNAIGLFAPFYQDRKVKFIGVEPGGKGCHVGEHAAAITYGTPAVIHGFAVPAHCTMLSD